MKFLYSLSGANVPVIKEFDTYTNEVVNAGDVVFLDIAGKVTKNFTNTVIGVCAETHSGKEDILNERSNKNKIRVDVTMGGVYEAEGVNVEAAQDCANNSFVCSADKLNTTFDGAKIVLVKKAEGSLNTDPVGTVRDVNGGMYNDGMINFTISNGSNISKGDVYTFYPAIGAQGSVSEGSNVIDFSNSTAAKVKVVGHDIKRGKLDVMFCSKVFEN